MNISNIKSIAFVGVMTLAALTTLNAAPYKGQKIYINTCKECHNGGQEFAASKKVKDWERTFKNKGQQIVDIHTNSKKAEAIVEYFNSEKWQKDNKQLKDFLTEYAKDSGKIPACN